MCVRDRPAAIPTRVGALRATEGHDTMNVTDDPALKMEECAATADAADDTVAALRRSRLCDGLAREELEQVAAKVRPIDCPAGQAICRVGQPGDSMFIVTNGRMKVTAAGHGGENRVLGYLCRGDHFGEIALLDAGKRTANVTAEIDSQVLVLERDCFQQLCDELPKVAKNLLRTLGLRFGDTLRGRCHTPVKRVVGLVQSCRRAAGLLPLLARQLAQRGEEVFVFSQRPSGEVQARTAELPAEDSESLRTVDWQRDIDRLSAGADRVLVEIEPPMEPTRLSAALDACDDILWLIDPSEEKLLRPVWTEVRQQSPSVAARSQIVWILRPSDQVAPAGTPIGIRNAATSSFPCRTVLAISRVWCNKALTASCVIFAARASGWRWAAAAQGEWLISAWHAHWTGRASHSI